MGFDKTSPAQHDREINSRKFNHDQGGDSMKRQLIALLIPCFIAVSSNIAAAEIKFIPQRTGAVSIALVGDIEPGDSDKLYRGSS